MYEHFYGLSGKPFSLLPDPDFLYGSKRHRMAINLLDYGMMTQAGFVVITGEVGTGKTTIIRRFLKSVGDDVTVGVISNSSKGLGRLLGWVSMAFELDHRGRDQIKLYNAFVAFLVDQYAQGRRSVLIIDEAQNLGAEALEELRMLSNVNNERDQLLQIVLVGQPELAETLRRPELRQFVQRIAVHCHLDPLSLDETVAYIRHRLAVVGGRAELFDDDACAAVHYFSNGIPRLINQLCDIALVYGFSDEAKTIDFSVIYEVAASRERMGLTPFRPLPVGATADSLRDSLGDDDLSSSRSA